MEILRVYGKRANAPETLIFGMLIDAPAYRATAAKTAAANGYTITRAIRVGTSRNGWIDEEIKNAAEYIR